MFKPLISPSILSADFSRLGEEVRSIDTAGADMIHIDVMDGHYVPNLTIGPGVIKSLKPHTKKPFDVHLMIAPVDSLIPDFADAGADIITIHPDAGPHFHRSLQSIRSLGCKAGVALNPATPIEVLEYVWDDIELILVMSVNPGFGGQKFIPTQLHKIKALSEKIKQTGRDIILEVDGGVNPMTSADCIRAGATALVAGSAVFKGSGTYTQNIEAIRSPTLAQAI